MKVFIVKIRNFFIPICICIFTLFLIFFSSSNLVAAKNGLILWSSSVVPSLFPFFIATELLGYTNIIPILGKMLNNIMRPIFNVPGEGSFALIMGIISGYPVGAKIVCNLKKQGICTNEECERLLAFTNNSGPLFIIGTVGISLFSNSKIGFKLFYIHLISCLLVGFLFRWWKSNKRILNVKRSSSNANTYVSFNNFGTVLSSSIQNATNTVILIGGFVVFFSVVISMLNSSEILDFCCSILSPLFTVFKIPIEYWNGIVTGIIELTNGVKMTALNVNPVSIIICSFLLGFGGISVLLQVLSITSEAKISIKPYILGKILQACFSAIFMYLLY